MSTRSPDPLRLGADEQGQPPLPWLADAVRQAAAMQRSHALLLHGPAGAGHLALAGLLAQAWLCEDPAHAPCGRCASCHLVRTRSHPDLLLVLPQATRVQLGWVSDDEAGAKSEAKPSREIRVEQVRQAIDWSHQTSGRGRGKALVLHPADAMNMASANALLKTLEEPPASLRLLLTTADPERLLPTVRSRCQRLRLALPAPEVANAWLRAQGLEEPAPLLALAAGSPLEALAWADEGITPAWLAEFPLRVAAGDSAPLAGRPIPRVVDLLLKLVHDLMAREAGGAPRFFTTSRWPGPADMVALVAWQKALLRTARHDEHPWSAALLVESLVTQATPAWGAGDAAAQPRQKASLHSAR